MFFNLKIKHTFKLLQANIEVDKSRFEARIELSKNKIYSPIISISCSRSDYYSFQISIVDKEIFDRNYYRSLNARTSIVLRVIFIDKNFDKVKYTILYWFANTSF